MGSLKYVFGHLLSELCKAAGVPPLLLDDFHKKASECGIYLRSASLGKLAAESLDKIKSLYHSLLDKSLSLVSDLKNQTLMVVRKLESKEEEIS